MMDKSIEVRNHKTFKEFIVIYMMHLTEKQNEERTLQLYRIWYPLCKSSAIQCIGRSTKGKRRLNWNSLEICLSDMHLKQNTQFEASKKGSLIKWELRRLRTCIQKQVSTLLELLHRGIDRHFFVLHIAGRYNAIICKHDIHPDERVILF